MTARHVAEYIAKECPMASGADVDVVVGEDAIYFDAPCVGSISVRDSLRYGLGYSTTPASLLRSDVLDIPWSEASGSGRGRSHIHWSKWISEHSRALIRLFERKDPTPMADHPSLAHVKRLLSGFGATLYPATQSPGWFSLSLGGTIYLNVTDSGRLEWRGSGVRVLLGDTSNPEEWRRCAAGARQVADALELLNRCADDIHAYVDPENP